MKNRRSFNLFTFFYCIFCLLIFPLAANSIYFLSKGKTDYENVWYPHFASLALLPTVFINLNSSKIKSAVRISFVVLIAVNIVTANNVYEKRKFVYDSTVSVISRMLTQIESSDSYIPGKTEVVLCGTLDKNYYYQNTTLNYFFPLATKNKTMTAQNTDVAVTFIGTYYNFLKVCMNSNINFYPYSQDYYDFQELHAASIKEMPVFPAKGSYKMIDGKMVVKLSETD